MSIYTEPSRFSNGAHCPSCAQKMHTLAVETRSVGTIDIDVCVPCMVIWFDNAESAQLAPSAVVDLFKIVNACAGKPRLALATSLPCPRCHTRLGLTHDICKAGRISYHRCPAHGRLTPFFHFLKEKQFIRQLNPLEIKQLGVSVKQISCSGCGGAINLEKDTACSFCGAPIAVLDADAVKEAMAVWAAAEAERRNSTSAELAEVELRIATAHAMLADKRGQSLPDSLLVNAANADLVSACIGTLGGLFALLGD